MEGQLVSFYHELWGAGLVRFWIKGIWISEGPLYSLHITIPGVEEDDFIWGGGGGGGHKGDCGQTAWPWQGGGYRSPLPRKAIVSNTVVEYK